MAMPTTREEFKEFCLRQLGKPVININVADSQVDDAVDMALSYFMDYHYDGSQKVYYKYKITDTDKVNKYITMPDNIIGAVRIFDLHSALGMGDMFNIQYQIALNDLYTLTSHSLVPYYMAMQHVQFIGQILVGQQPIRFQRHTNRLHIDMNWSRFETGQYLVIECTQVIDPDDYEDIWKDRWLLRYTQELIKKQWGSNMKKFGEMKLPSGIVLNGQQIYNEAVLAIQQLEEEMISSYSRPVQDEIG